MVGHHAELGIPVPRMIVRAILLEPAALPEWNPAFRGITAGWRAQVGVRYPLAVRGGLTGYFQYTATGERRIEGNWRVPGLAETHSWILIPDGDGTLVRHWFENTGPLAALLRGAFENVADLRLERLSGRAIARLGARTNRFGSVVRRAYTGAEHDPAHEHRALGRLAGAVRPLPEREPT
jgi:hypothetical protein